ncbi:triosephosphate isomerase [Kordiimonas sediminis]|uniref:Triosephosphate isomerase n=1 Tax=Kordiimonas sediminis TaxID=1735581 RepID=A0A919E9W5_9PROT|nr:triose-phosphate isomerase [Kordiimonas sediminis]GHF28370.1 triosephosphate isomerase [Kordiimonas sediminis]
MSNPTALVAGNWKMNGLTESLAELEALETLVKEGKSADCDVLICPPFTLIGAASVKADAVAIGAQDCHGAVSGAHTGDISAQMLKDAGATYVIVGHSERRADHFENSKIVKVKAEAALAVGLTAIVCVGETEAERDAGKAVSRVVGQVEASLPEGATSAKVVVAYEPVWAIGTGRTPTVQDVAEMHTAIREALIKRLGEDGKAVKILYGGSVKPSNATELMGAANVNGALVGGASLKASDFNGIIDAYRK